jgi:hypothetical protein
MAEKKPVKKAPQMSLEEYNKVKEQRAKHKLKLQFPLVVKLFLLLPLGYFIFLITYYLAYLRFTAQH